MQLSRFLGVRVIDAAQHPVGTIVDVRLVMTGDPERNPAAPRVLGLVISPHTAKHHVSSVLGKLGAVSRAEAGIRARDLGLA